VKLHDVYDLAGQFSASANPGGPWTYGWSASAGGALTVFPNSATEGSTCSYIPKWQDASILVSGTPCLLWNSSATDCYGCGPGYACLHPGCHANEYAVARFTAPSTQGCELHVELLAGNSGETTGDVLLNGTSLYHTDTTSGHPVFDTSLAIVAGDVIDVAVGTAGGCGSDTTPVVFRLVCDPS
jgi:hypothetical protein